ncbi:MAG: hypothetical protein AAB492_03750 [Patescibacteria group bacterium]
MKARNFTKVVEHSRALNTEEKRDLVAVVDALPEEYKEKVSALLETFDEHSNARQEYLREKLEEVYKNLEYELETDGVGEEKKKELLAKAREQIGKFVYIF